jgi:chemotaxis protein methyltransferase CheR
MQIQVLKKDELRTLKELISGYTGFTFNASREHSLIQALSKFSEEQNCSTPIQFERLLRSNEELMKKFTERLLIHETYFFREKESLVQLITLLKEKRAASAEDDRPVRIWSAGCSTGEEPYSLALLLSESSFKSDYRLVATDISQHALNHANLAQYSEWSLRALDAELREKYFDRGMKSYRLKDEYAKQRVTFVKANLTSDNQLSAEWLSLDAIVCRNVLIYFERSVIEKLAKTFFSQLKPGGILLTGASDPPLNGYTDFEVEYTKTGVIYRKPVEETIRTGAGKSQGAPAASSRKSLNQPAAHAVASCNTLPTAGVESTRSSTSASRKSLNARSSQAHHRVAKETENKTSLLRDSVAKLYRDGHWQEVVSLLEHQPAISRSLLIRSLLNLSRIEEATILAESACQTESLDATNHLLLALVMMSEQRQKEAAAVIRKALFLDRNYIVGHFLLGISSFCTGDREQAAKSMKNAQTLLKALPHDATIPLAEDDTPDQFAANVQRYLSIIEQQ